MMSLFIRSSFPFVLLSIMLAMCAGFAWRSRMSSDTLACPWCRAKLRRSPTLQAGDPVACPRCRQKFPCPAVDGDPASPLMTAALPPRPVAERTILPTGYTETPAAREEAPLPQRREQPPVTEEDEDHPLPSWRSEPLILDRPEPKQIDLSAWFRYAREHWARIFWPSAGFSLLVTLGIGVLCLVPCVGPLVALLLLPPLWAGHSIVALAQLKGQRWTFGDFFDGFRWGGAILGLAFLKLVFSLLLIPLASALLTLVDLKPSEAGVGMVVVVLISTGTFAALDTRLFTFALPLVLDRHQDVSGALGECLAVTRGRFWKLLGLNLVLWLINFGGAVCFLVGLLITIPFTTLVWNAGYLLVSGTQPPVYLTERSRAGQQRYDTD
jgi:hypothetical protein